MKESQTEKTSSVLSNSSSVKPVSTRARLKFAGITFFILILLFSLLMLAFSKLQQKPSLGVVLTTPLAARTLDKPLLIHTFPDTLKKIHVFNDQLAAWDMSEAQFEFAATHYDGTQKVFASDVRRFRAHNPNFIVLNYRLGLGLGYQNIVGDCQPNGTWLEIIEGEKWLREYPEDPPDAWFYKSNGQRVLFCEWGWYLMDVSNASWREYWAGEVLRQLRTNTADGVFVDALFPPNYNGGDKFIPNLPALDQTFENTWSSKIEDFITFGQSGELADYYFIPNVGQWVTGRDVTDYSAADGILVEGFGRWAGGEYFSAKEGDWQLQMDRILSMVNLDKIVILQQYINKEEEGDRMFLLGNYLLIKGNHTYINLELSANPEWFPEYQIPIGIPVGGNPASISSLWRSDWDIYARSYSNGLVLVNPSDQKKEIFFDKPYYQAFPYGGGIVPSDGDISTWTVDYVQVDSVSLDPNRAAILLNGLPE